MLGDPDWSSPLPGAAITVRSRSTMSVAVARAWRSARNARQGCKSPQRHSLIAATSRRAAQNQARPPCSIQIQEDTPRAAALRRGRLPTPRRSSASKLQPLPMGLAPSAARRGRCADWRSQHSAVTRAGSRRVVAACATAPRRSMHRAPVRPIGTRVVRCPQNAPWLSSRSRSIPHGSTHILDHYVDKRFDVMRCISNRCPRVFGECIHIILGSSRIHIVDIAELFQSGTACCT